MMVNRWTRLVPILIASVMMLVTPFSAAARPSVTVGLDQSAYAAKHELVARARIKAILHRAFEPSGDFDPSFNSESNTIRLVVWRSGEHQDLLARVQSALALEPRVTVQRTQFAGFQFRLRPGTSWDRLSKAEASLLSEILSDAELQSEFVGANVNGLTPLSQQERLAALWRPTIDQAAHVTLEWLPVDVFEVALGGRSVPEAKPNLIEDLFAVLAGLEAPEVEVIDQEDGLIVRARSRDRVADRAAIARSVLETRADLALNILQDGALSVRFIERPGPAPTPSVGELSAAVRSRLSALKLAPVVLTPRSGPKIEVEFGDQAQADAFELALTDPWGFAVRIEDVPPAETSPPVTRPTSETLQVAWQGERLRLKSDALLTGDMLVDPRAVFDATPSVLGGVNGWLVVFQIAPDGADSMYAATSENLGRRFVITVDGEVVNVVVVNSAFGSPAGMNLPCDCSETRAKALAMDLRRLSADLPLRVLKP